MQTKVVFQTKISDEDKMALQTAFYNMEGLKKLINEGLKNEFVISKYQKAYQEYSIQYSKILRKYASDIEANTYNNWECSFFENTLTLYFEG